MKTMTVSGAKARLLEIVREVAASGEAVQLTRNGAPVARIVPEAPKRDPEAIDRALRKIQEEAARRLSERSWVDVEADLYGEDGMPR